MYAYLCDINVVKFDLENKIFTFKPSQTSPPTLARDLIKTLLEWTGENWSITASDEVGDESINKKFMSELQLRKNKAIEEQDVIKILETFKGSKVINTIDVAE